MSRTRTLALALVGIFAGSALLWYGDYHNSMPLVAYGMLFYLTAMIAVVKDSGD